MVLGPECTVSCQLQLQVSVPRLAQLPVWVGGGGGAMPCLAQLPVCVRVGEGGHATPGPAPGVGG